MGVVGQDRDLLSSEYDGQPMTAQDQYLQGVGQQQSNALSLARSMRGQNYAQARQAVAGAQSRAAQEGDVGLRAMQAQEQDQARNQYAQFLADQRGLAQQDYFGRLGSQQDMQRFYEQLANEQRKQALGGSLAYDQLGANQSMQDYGIRKRKQAVDEANEFHASDIYGPVLGAGGAILGGMAGGPGGAMAGGAAGNALSGGLKKI
jgi:hypothetical protein